MVCSNRLVALSPPGLSLFLLQGCHILSCRSSRANRNEMSAARYVKKVRISREIPFSHDLKQVNFNARTTCTNSSGVKPDLGWDRDQQWKINYRTNWKADRTVKNDKFNAQYFGLDRTNLLRREEILFIYFSLYIRFGTRFNFSLVLPTNHVAYISFSII